jgi:hypothetical protein
VGKGALFAPCPRGYRKTRGHASLCPPYALDSGFGLRPPRNDREWRSAAPHLSWFLHRAKML